MVPSRLIVMIAAVTVLNLLLAMTPAGAVVRSAPKTGKATPSQVTDAVGRQPRVIGSEGRASHRTSLNDNLTDRNTFSEVQPGGLVIECLEGDIAAKVDVLDVNSYRPSSGKSVYGIETTTTVLVLDTSQDAELADQVTIWQPGGELQTGELTWSPHVPILREDEEYLVCLYTTSASEGFYYVASAISLSHPTTTHRGSPSPSPNPVLDDPTVTGLLDEAYDVLANVDPGWTRINESYRFKFRTLPSEYFINRNASGITGEGPAVQRAVETWEGVANAWVKWDFQGNTTTKAFENDAENVVAWNVPQDDPNCERFSARAHLHNRSTAGSWDIEFNQACNWVHASPPPSGSGDIEHVAAHEFGHVLGLDHTTRKNNVMCVRASRSCGDPPWGQRSLGSGDKAGTRFLYPFNDFRATIPETEYELTLCALDLSPACPNEDFITIDAMNTGFTPWIAQALLSEPFAEVRLLKLGSGCSEFWHPNWVDDCRIPLTYPHWTEFSEVGILSVWFQSRSFPGVPPDVVEEKYRLNAVGFGNFGPTITVRFHRAPCIANLNCPLEEAP